jgi:DNA replication protein DnaC
MASGEVERLRDGLEKLGLSQIQAHFQPLAQQAAQERWSYTTFLARVVEAEVLDQDQKALEHRLKAARFPRIYCFSDYDFPKQPGVDEKAVKELASLAFLDEHANLVFLGKPGVGKTMLSIAFGVRAVEAGYRVLFTTAYDLVKDLYASLADGTDRKLLRKLARIPLLIIDELGHTNLSSEQAHLLFELISRRTENASTIVTSNKSVSAWGRTVPDATVMAALVDRLLDACHLFNIKGQTCRGNRRRTYPSGEDPNGKPGSE